MALDWGQRISGRRKDTAMDGFGFDYLNDSITREIDWNIVDFDGSVSTVTSHE